MRKVITFLIAAAALAAPGTAFAADPPSAEDQANAARRCQAQRTTMGDAAFRQLYGTNRTRSNAFGKCVSKLARAEQENRQNAAQQCRAEQKDPNFAASHGGRTFEQFYGTGRNGRNAFGRCVASKARTASTEEQQTTLNAAQACKAQRTAMGDTAFRQLYGTNRNRANAFGKCVSKLSQAENQNRTNAARQCRAEQSDPNFAASHGGKTFEQFYGTNENGSNAFGECVSSKARAASTEQQQATVNAARACKAERASLGERAFNAKYGNKANAFGRCVSMRARQR